ncbi:MAG: hypothetical protein JSV35_00765, partial [Candidatus Bathyarchaeota archaeon]
NEGSDPLYKLTRIAESHQKEPGRLSLICILRELRWLNKLDASTRSTLQSNIIPLDVYTQRQLHDILNDRIPLAFRADVVPEETVMLVSELGEEEGGNARYAIDLLWRAGKYADTEKSGEVAPEHVRKAVGSVYSTVRRDEIAALAPHEKLLLLALARRFQQTATAHLSMGDAEESYRIVCEEFDEEPRGHTQLWKYVKRLSNLGVINATISTSGVRGKTTLIGLPRVPASDLENELTGFLTSEVGRI